MLNIFFYYIIFFSLIQFTYSKNCSFYTFYGVEIASGCDYCCTNAYPTIREEACCFNTIVTNYSYSWWLYIIIICPGLVFISIFVLIMLCIVNKRHRGRVSTGKFSKFYFFLSINLFS